MQPIFSVKSTKQCLDIEMKVGREMSVGGQALVLCWAWERFNGGAGTMPRMWWRLFKERNYGKKSNDQWAESFGVVRVRLIATNSPSFLLRQQPLSATDSPQVIWSVRRQRPRLLDRA